MVGVMGQCPKQLELMNSSHNPTAKAVQAYLMKRREQLVALNAFPVCQGEVCPYQSITCCSQTLDQSAS